MNAQHLFSKYQVCTKISQGCATTTSICFTVHPFLPSVGRGLPCCWQYPGVHCTPALRTISVADSQVHWGQQAWTLELSLYLRRVKETAPLINLQCIHTTELLLVTCLCCCKGWPWVPHGCCLDRQRGALFFCQCSWEQWSLESWKCSRGTSGWLRLSQKT